MTLRILTAGDVRALMPMADCIDVMRDAMVALAQGQVAMPPRVITPLADGRGLMATMPGSSRAPAVDGAKLVTLMPGNPAAGRAAVQGVVVLFDHATGAPMALLDGAEITALRTAAVSGLATRLLARPDARSHGILGTGVQARMHIDAIHAARPLLTEVRVWGRDHARTMAFAVQEATRTGRTVRAVPSAQAAAECDIVSTTTGAALPVLQGHWLHAGAHVNLVGAHRPAEREADTTTITRASVYVDLMESAMNEAGDLLLPIAEGAFAADRIVGELGQLAAGQIPGRTSAAQITLFKSLGVVAQDLFAAWAVLQRAVESDAGTVVNF